MHCHSRTLLAAALVSAWIFASEPTAFALETEKLNFIANLSEKRVAGSSEYDFTASLSGVWARDLERSRWELTLMSDYDRALTADEEYDRLKTWFRYLMAERAKTQWNPLIAVSTEGDHGLDQVHTLVALGVRRHFNGGFVEFTGGASKDLRTAENWMGDVGALISLQQDYGRFTWTVNPEVNYGLLGEVRFRDNRTIYAFSSALKYHVSDGMGIAYRLQLNNSQGDDRRHQFLGVSYSYRK